LKYAGQNSFWGEFQAPSLNNLYVLFVPFCGWI